MPLDSWAKRRAVMDDDGLPLPGDGVNDLDRSILLGILTTAEEASGPTPATPADNTRVIAARIVTAGATPAGISVRRVRIDPSAGTRVQRVRDVASGNLYRVRAIGAPLTPRGVQKIVVVS